MAAKKHVKKQNKTPRTFKSNPFNAMKGFCVSDSNHVDAADATDAKNGELPSEKSLSSATDNSHREEDIDFTAAMGGIGVEPLQDRDSGLELNDPEQREMKDKLPPDSESSFYADELTDEDLFLHHLGRMDAVFSDSYPDSDQSAQEQASARRMRQLRKGRLRPEATLDLHGCYREEARKKVRNFLESRQRQGMKTVLIITGRGLRSKNGESVIRSDIEAYLRTRAKAWVVEWGRAPKQYGGDGALVVFLR
jgi:DNA-nicking Smr family endonuclease